MVCAFFKPTRSNIILLLILVSCLSNSLNAVEIRVAVAANFYPVLLDVVEVFEQQTNHEVILVSGSSGKLTAQISLGAPFDLFLSADVDRPYFLETHGFVEEDSRFTYALGRLVVIARKTENETNMHGVDSISPLEQLKRHQFNQLSIANPNLAPYGLAATQVLEKFNVEPEKASLIYGENVSQAFHFFQIGRTDLAILSLSQVIGLAIDQDQYEEIPQNYYQVIEQQMVLLKSPNRSNEGRSAARELHQYLLSDVVQYRLAALGYSPIASGFKAGEALID